MAHLFQIIFYQPILNLLIFLYNTIPGENLGVAIIVSTLVIKIVLLPLSQKSIKAQKALQDLQPKIDEIKKKYKDKKEQMGKAMMGLYKEEKVSPFSSCFPLLIQLPFLWAVFRVFRDGISSNLDLVYSFIAVPENIHNIWFGIDLSKPNVYLAILAGLAQFWQAKMMIAKRPATKGSGSRSDNMTTIMNKQMVYFMPLITVFIGLTLPGGLTLYWFVVTLFTALQQLIMFRKQSQKEKEPIVIEQK